MLDAAISYAWTTELLFISYTLLYFWYIFILLARPFDFSLINLQLSKGLNKGRSATLNRHFCTFPNLLRKIINIMSLVVNLHPFPGTNNNLVPNQKKTIIDELSRIELIWVFIDAIIVYNGEVGAIKPKNYLQFMQIKTTRGK